MHRIIIIPIALLFLLLAASPVRAAEVTCEQGWHEGPYFTLHGGMLQSTNDENAITGRSFDGPFDPAMGITFGWDVADWIGPMLQLTYATAKAQVGDPANATAPVTHGCVTYPQGTFPLESARQHLINIGLFARATLPSIVYASWQPRHVKIIPYAKFGGTAELLFMSGASNANETASAGGGLSLGGGVEFFIWKGIYLGVDATEHLIFHQACSRTITDSDGVARDTIVNGGGLKSQFQLLGLLGWHF